MNEKLCSTCGGKISPARLAAIEKCEECRECVEKRGDVQKLQGVMTWEHKTAPTIHIGTPKEIEAIQRLSRRGPRPQLPFSPKGGVSDLRLKTDDTRVAREATNLLMARCHPDRPRVGVSDKCAQCALEWYARRKPRSEW